MKRLLLIAYFYPPLGGPAVQRPVKTIKYLTELGWEVDVITVDGIIYHSTDSSLADECFHKRIFRTPSLDPMYILNKIKQVFRLPIDKLYQGATSSHKNLVRHIFPIDEKVGWLPFVVQAGLQALRTKPYNAVMVTCNPFSASLAGLYLANQAHIPFVIDYRDHWTLNNAIEQPTGLLYKIYQRLERYILSKAALITTATGVMKNDLISTFGNNLQDKITPFFNGWDETDFTSLTYKPRQTQGSAPYEDWDEADFRDIVHNRPSTETITISYFGALYRDRTISTFLQAVKELLPQNPQLEIQLTGNFFAETKAEIEHSGISHKVKLVNQLTHHEALQAMCDSDIFLLIIGDEKLKWVLTGKLFEYLRSQRPIIALAPKNGEAAEILKECGHDSICDIHEPQEIKATLAKLIDRIKTNSFSFTIPYQYERSEQVKKFAARLDQIV